jgi:hypothetical protein
VRNNYHPKASENDDNKTGSGLVNIEKRYELLSSKKPTFTILDDQFIVEIPLINIG